jgi:hypothetical protein
VSDEDPTAFIRRGPRQRCGRFEDSASESRHLLDDLIFAAAEILRICDVVDAIEESADDRQLRSKAVKSKLRLEPSVVR